MRNLPLIFLSLLMSSVGFAALDLNEQMVFNLNKVSPDLCTKEKNSYSETIAAYFACERARKILYGTAADLTQVENGDPKGPAINILGAEDVAPGINSLTSYVVEPPLQNKPEFGGIDWSSADALIRSAARNLIQPVTDASGKELRYPDGRKIPNHGISHAFINLQCEGLKPILTGMTTAKDIEAPLNFFVHNLGLGILFRTQAGRLNTYNELAEEMAVRKQQVGNLTFVKYNLSPENCRFVYYSVMEMVAEGVQKRYGSLSDRMLNGTGMGCAMFDVGVKQMAGIIPLDAESLTGINHGAAVQKQCEFYEQWNRNVYVPNDYLPTYSEDSELLSGAKVGILSLLLSGNDAEAFIYWSKYLTSSLFEAVKAKMTDEASKQRVATLSKVFTKGLKFADLAPEVFQKGVQLSLNGRVFINETLAPKNAGYPWDLIKTDTNEYLQFWDPQLFATWTRTMNRELKDLAKGKIEPSAVRCYTEKTSAYKAANDGQAVGLEMDMTSTEPLLQSLFLEYDEMRALKGEKVDPFRKFDGPTDALPQIFKNTINHLGSN